MKRYIVPLFILLGLVCAQVYSQAVTSSLSGTVLDASGGVIPTAKVTLTNTGTNAVRTAETNSNGGYLFSNLGVGTYKLEVNKEGYAKYVQDGIVLQVNSSPAIVVTMKVGETTQTVQVEANAAMVETQSTGVGQVVNPEQVVDLPLNGRQANQLILLSGAAVTNNTGALQVSLDYPSTVAISVAGSQGNDTNYYLDGALNQDIRTDLGLPMPFPDALQEFKVESSAMPANFGRSPGGTVQAATMSGTNQVHGDVFEFIRNSDMDAKIDYSGKPDNLKRNQFGGVVGGPIIRNKVFLFGGFQETMERVLSAPASYTVPTQANLTGDFSAQLGPAVAPTGGKCPAGYLNQAYTTGTSLLCTNVLNSAYLTAKDGSGATTSAGVAANLATYWPTPTGNNGTILVSPYTHDNEAQGVMRADWVRNDKDSLFARYFVANYNLLPYYQSGNLLTAYAPGLNDQVQGFVLGDTYVLSSKIVSAPRVFFTRMAVVRNGAAGIPNWTKLGSNVTSELPNYLGNAGITNYIGTLAIPSFPGYDYDNVYGVSEDISLLEGKHSINAGFVWTHNQMNADATSNVNPGMGFANGASSIATGNALADFVGGFADSFSQANGQLGRDGQNLPSLYFQDNWKAFSHLQLNLGLRWDPYYAQHTKYGWASDFSLANFAAGKTSTAFTNAPAGLTFPGDAGFNGKSDTNNHLNNFAPRVGLVWDPRGKGQETIRAGYGFFYNQSIMWNAMVVVLNPPFGSSIRFTPLLPAAPGNAVSTGAGLANPWYGQAVSNPFPTPMTEPSNYTFPIAGQYSTEDQNIKPTYTQEWNLSIQKQVTPNWMLSATYLGSHTTHMWLGVNLQPSLIIGSGSNYPGVSNNAGVSGTTGGCTLTWMTYTYNFTQCNGGVGDKVAPVGGVGPTINSEQARAALTLRKPTVGPYFGGMAQNQSLGNASYQGLLLVAQHRLSNNFSVLMNYTWSHCLDMADVSENLNVTFQNPSNPKGDWGNCASDRRQSFNGNFVAESPNVGNRLTREIIGNWSWTGIATVTSGAWLNMTDGSDVSLTGIGQDRPNKVGNPFAAGTVSANPTCVAPTAVKQNGRGAHWFNPCAYMNQASTAFGNTHRDDLVGPGNWNFDTALFRTFNLTERYKLIFRAEAFNVFNHMEMGNPATSLTSPLDGQVITSAAGSNARLLQMAAKINF